MLPDGVRAGVEASLGAIRTVEPVGGGCIARAMKIETEGGPAFLKHHGSAPARFFAAEADGLAALRDAADGEVRVPGVLARSEEAGPGPAWIALEWLEPAPRADDFAERLGRGVAAVHRGERSRWWGWGEGNYIGSLPQENAASGTWGDFWRDRRLTPQLDMARFRGALPATAAEWERLFERLPDLLAPAEDDGPSLLHGDLWSGNVICAGGEPALIDPAVYRGHREADLAMTELFGGFDARFYAAYEEAWPLLPGYREQRRAVYQLYYLLVHVNLFGGSYVGQTAALLRRILAA